ncbi:MAG: hypothetical protein ABIR26_04120, partial [Ramlibacter sp.]
MADKHFYNSKGNYVGRVSERGPSESGPSDRVGYMEGFFCFVAPLLGALWGYYITFNEGLFSQIFVCVFVAGAVSLLGHAIL